MSVDFHRHCQATVLSANGTDAQNGLSWIYISELKDSLKNLPEDWIEEFKENHENITQDLASILKIMNKSIGRTNTNLGGYIRKIIMNNTYILPSSSGEANLGDVVSSVKVNGDIKTPDSNGLVDIGSFSVPDFSVANKDENGTTISSINYNGNQYDIKMPQSGVKPPVSDPGGSEINISFDAIYPVGSIYISATAKTEEDLPPIFRAGGRRWERISAGMCLWSANDDQLDKTIPAGLPSLPAIKMTAYSANGLDGNSGLNGLSDSSNGVPTTMKCYAEPHNIYGKSTTVQPPAFGVTMWKRVS